MTGFEKEIWNRLKYVGFAFALCSFIATLQEYLRLSRIEFLGTLTTIGMALLIIVMWSGFRGIANDMKNGFNMLKDTLSKNPYPEEEKKEESKTTGAGAFGGMVIGGLLGLILGPAGVVIGGLIGAVIGDQIERENIKAERERRRKEKT